MQLFSSVILALCCNLAFGQEYNITRQVTTTDAYDQPDLVQIPSSLCHDNGTTECPSMDGERYSVCQCTCAKIDAAAGHHYYKSTFGFYNGTWKCEKNSALRRRSGCKLSLDRKGLNASFRTVSNERNANSFYLVISNVTTTKYLSIPENDTDTCSLKIESSMYLTCFGKWKQLKPTLVIKRFHIDYHNWNNIMIKVNYTEGSSYPLPSGRIIKLAVTCTDRPWEPSQCILLKIEGQLQCPVSSPLPTNPETQPPETQPPETQPPVNWVNPTPVPSLTSQPSTTSSSRKPGGNINAPKKDSGIAFSTGLIIGISLSGVAVLAALIILIFFIIRIRKRRFIRENDSKSSAAELVLENGRTYGERFGDAQNSPHQIEEQADQEVTDVPQLADVVENQYDYAMAHPANTIGCEKCGNPVEIGRHSENYGYEIMDMDGLNNSLSNYHVCRCPTYDYVKPEQEQKKVLRPADGEKSSVYSSLVGNVPHVYASLQVPHETDNQDTADSLDIKQTPISSSMRQFKA